MKSIRFSYALLCLLVIPALSAACAGSLAASPTLQPSAAAPTAAIPTLAPGSTAAPLPTLPPPPNGASTPLPASTTPAGAASASPSSSTPTTGGATPPYLDDRSSPDAVVRSFVNAINSQEYARAYSYWEPGSASQLPPFDQFQQGYADTASVQLTIGTVGMGAAAGNLYWSVPVVMIAQTKQGATQTFAGCYLLHLGQPANQGVPPFQPTGIQSARIETAPNGSDKASLLAHACEGPGMPQGLPVPPQPATNPADISPSRYLDDRSDAVQVIRSLFNAINRKEYVRAYSYWEPGAASAGLPPYPQFEQGYADTASVQLTTGSVRSDVGAGQLYYAVPVKLTVKTTSGQTQLFAGCYSLHLARPEIQAAPPFQPMGIRSGQIKLVTNDAEATAAMNSSCP